MKELLCDVASRASRYLAGINERPVAPSSEAIARLHELGGPLPDASADPAQLLALLDEIGSPATVATTGGRYFGFVVGGTLPASLAANWLAGAWLRMNYRETSGPLNVGQNPQLESRKGRPERLKIERVTDGNHPGPAPSK